MPLIDITHRRGGRAVAAASLLAVAALSLTACQQDGQGNAAPAGNSAPSAAAANGGGTGTANNSGGSHAGTAHAGATGASSVSASDRCTAANMSLRLGPSDIGAGNIRYPLIFTNKGSRTCSLGGFPGVSLLGGDGQQIGSPATREGGPNGVVRLAPGQSAHAVLHTANEGVSDKPCWASASIVKVYAPGSKDEMTARTSGFKVCGDVFGVGAVMAGAEG